MCSAEERSAEELSEQLPPSWLVRRKPLRPALCAREQSNQSINQLQ